MHSQLWCILTSSSDNSNFIDSIQSVSLMLMMMDQHIQHYHIINEVCSWR
jgi:hypothetical protein